jgi:hypothetical protein
MLILEHPHHQQFADQVYDLDQSIQEPYPGLAMDSYNVVDPMVNFHPLPYSYFENPSMFSTTPLHTKQEMHQAQELPPALISSSACSSTVGSPYSGPSYTIASQDDYSYDYGSAATYGLGVMPTIVNHDIYTHEFGRPMEAELSISSHEKLSDSFVGKSADLSSSQHRLSTVGFPVSQHVHHIAPSPPLCLAVPSDTSPEVVSIDATLEKRCGGVPSGCSASAFPSVSCARAHNPRPAPTFKSPTTPASARSRSALGPTFPSHLRSFFKNARTQIDSLHPGFVFIRDPHQSQASVTVNRFQSHFFALRSGEFHPTTRNILFVSSAVSSISFSFDSVHLLFT